MRQVTLLRRLLVVVSLFVVLGLSAGCAAPVVGAVTAGQVAGTTAGVVAAGVTVKTAVEVSLIAIPIAVPLIASLIGTDYSGADTITLQMVKLTSIPAGASDAWTNTADRTPTPKKYMIAIVDDDDMYSKTTAEILLYKITAEITWYASCEALISNFRPYDLFIMDGELPGLTGPTCSGKIQSLQPGAIIIGASASHTMVQRFHDLGLAAINIAEGPAALFALIKAALGL